MTFAAVGYPKVGNTWLRLTIGRYLLERYRLPEMPLMDPAEFPMLSAAGCRAVGEFTHAPLDWSTQTGRDLSIQTVVAPFRPLPTILLTRHPLDTLVSLFMQEKFRNRQSPYAGPLSAFIEDPVFGLEKLLRFHQLWAEGKASMPALLLWRYEDALDDPAGVFARVLEFLGEPVDRATVANAVEYASFTNMKAMEASGNQPVYKSSGFRIFATGDDTSNPDAFHVRRGRAGAYRDEIPADLIEPLEARVAAGMPSCFGYC